MGWVRTLPARLARTGSVADAGAATVRDWSALLLPLACAGCGVTEQVVCPRCRDGLLRGPLRRRTLPDGTPAVASASFRGPARGLVVAAKERGRRDVGDVLALALARAVADVGWGARRTSRRLLLVPPPARWVAVWRRADRPTERLAACAARQLRRAGADVVAVDLLRHTRLVRDQGGLDRAARAENLVGALAVRRASPWRWEPALPAGCDVVVVDDVMTTGATVLAAAAALREAGARVLGAAVVASV